MARLGLQTLGQKNSLPIASLEAQGPVNPLDQEQDDWLPAHQPPHPIQQLAIHHVGLLPRVGEHPLEIHLLMAVWAGLLLAHYAPPSDAELMKLVSTSKSECILYYAFFISRNQQLVSTN